MAATHTKEKGAMMHQPWTRRHALRGLSVLGALWLRPVLAWAQPQDALDQPALRVLASLTAAQRRQAVYPFEVRERRDWHYIPRRRPGLALGDMTPPQHELLWTLLGAGLSEQGIQKTRGVIATEAILGELSGSPGSRDPGNYAVVFFGTPASGQPWGWRFEQYQPVSGAASDHERLWESGDPRAHALEHAKDRGLRCGRSSPQL